MEGVLLYRGLFLVRMRENTDQKNSEYGHFSRSDALGWKKLFANEMLSHNSVMNEQKQQSVIEHKL